MNTTDITASPELLCKAVFDVTALTFDAKDQSELAAAAVLVQKLMDNFELAAALAESVAKHSLINMAADDRRRRFARSSPLIKAPAINLGADFLSDDLPLESSSEMPQDPAPASVHIDHFLPMSFPILESGNAAAGRQNLLVFYSPEALGFPFEGSTFGWSSETENKWGQFLQLAEMKLSRPEKLKTKGKTDDLNRVWKKVREESIYSTAHRGKNYSIVELKAGAGRSAVHLLYESTTLYVMVIFNETTTLRTSVHAEDVDDFAKDMVTAFHGHTDFAKGALTSLRRELTP